jgi:hypothetical protein
LPDLRDDALHVAVERGVDRIERLTAVEQIDASRKIVARQRKQARLEQHVEMLFV